MTASAIHRPHRDTGMEGMLAKWYAAHTGEMMKEYIALAHRVAGQIPAGSKVLDVAPGPGYFCIELARAGNYSITGLDISHTFVKMAAKKAAAAGVQVDFRQGTAARLPFPAESFDFLLCRAAFKNFAEPVSALREMCRVLRPGGRALLIDLKKNASPDEISHRLDTLGLSPFNRFLTKLAFRTSLLKRALNRAQFEHMLGLTKFGNVEIAESEIGFEISMTK
jgi:ubiquinone/menaquinone biosynthesis C-methylase UbiE